MKYIYAGILIIIFNAIISVVVVCCSLNPERDMFMVTTFGVWVMLVPLPKLYVNAVRKMEKKQRKLENKLRRKQNATNPSET